MCTHLRQIKPNIQAAAAWYRRGRRPLEKKCRSKHAAIRSVRLLTTGRSFQMYFQISVARACRVQLFQLLSNSGRNCAVVSTTGMATKTLLLTHAAIIQWASQLLLHFARAAVRISVPRRKNARFFGRINHETTWVLTWYNIPFCTAKACAFSRTRCFSSFDVPPPCLRFVNDVPT